MALLNKIFSSRKKNQKQGYVSFGKNESVSWKPFAFSKQQVRVILFRECDWRGRKLLFDSETVQKIVLDTQQTKSKFGSKQKLEKKKKNESYVEVTNGYGYQYLRPNQDVTVVGEMIFGSVAMSFKGNAFKVHTLKSPERLMCTKVFQSPGAGNRTKKISDHSLEDSYSSSVSSVSDCAAGPLSSSSDFNTGKTGSGPLDVPFSELRGKAQYSSLEADSGFCGDMSLQSPSSTSSVGLWPSYLCSTVSRNSSGDSLSGGSLASLRRRWFRSVSTSLEIACSASSGLFNSRNSSSSDTSSSVGTGHRRTKLGLTMIVSLSPGQERDMETFLLEHMAILESMLERLQLAVDRAYLRKDMFVHLMMEAWEDLSQWLGGLISAPRPPCPLWVGLGMAPASLHSSLATYFLQDLCYLISSLDTKANNFFVSTLITAVLTHHLGWVGTVIPNKETGKATSRTSCSSRVMSSLARSYPYSALWAQLGDLSGAICFPTKVARTIVTSSNSKQGELVNKIVNCLTYFIRCGAIEKHSNICLDSEITISKSACAFETSPSASMKSSAVSVSTLTDGLSDLHVQERPEVCGPEVKTVHHSFNCTLPKEKSSAKFNFIENSGCVARDDISAKSCASEETQKKKNTVNDVFTFKSATKLSCEVSAENMCSPARAEWDRRDISSALNKCESFSSKTPIITYSNTLSSDSEVDFGATLFRGTSTDSTRTLTECSLQSPTNFSGMKRSTSFFNKVTSSLGATEPSSGLYPSMVAVDVLEDSVNNNALHPEVISDKVNRLCRVPTEAVMYHHQAEQTESKDIYNLFPSIVNCERQMSAVDINKLSARPYNKVDRISPFESRTNSSLYDCFDEPDSGIDSNIGSANTKSESVIFVLGDNEELVGLKNKREEVRTLHLNGENLEVQESTTGAIDNNGNIDITNSATLSVSNTDNKISVCGTTSSDVTNTRLENQNKHHNFVPTYTVSKCLCGTETCKISDKLCCECPFLRMTDMYRTSKSQSITPSETNQCGVGSKWELEPESLIDSNCEGRIVTVHSSYIELEDERDCRHTRAKPVLRPNKPVTRSQSLSFPLCKKPSSKQSSICRRHSEYLHSNERYLKNYHSVRFNFERCESVLNNYVDGTGQEKTPEVDEINGARGNFEHQEPLCEVPQCRQCQCNAKLGINVNSKCSCDCNSEKCANETPVKYRPAESRPTYLDTDISREGNALFDEYSNLSDEEVTTPTENTSECVERNEVLEDAADAVGDKIFVELPLPSSLVEDLSNLPVGSGMAASLLGGVTDHYLPDLILQGCIQPVRAWESALRRDLMLSARHPPIDQDVSEAVCIVANTDSWDVQLLSNHAYVTDRPGTLGVHVGMSQLVANMLESLLLLWRLHTPVEQCLHHMESKLRELYLRSQAVGEMLLCTDFCEMATLTTALGLDANDIPLLIAVASTHSPQVTQRYGVSFR